MLLGNSHGEAENIVVKRKRNAIFRSRVALRYLLGKTTGLPIFIKVAADMHVRPRSVLRNVTKNAPLFRCVAWTKLLQPSLAEPRRP